MKNRLGFDLVPSLVACVFLSGVPASLSAQTTTPADVQVNVSEGIYHFLQGNRAGYEKALELFTAALEEAPDHPAALLFRALSHGRIGLDILRNKNKATNSAEAWEQTAELRANSARSQEMQAEVAKLEALLEEDTDKSAEWVLNQSALVGLQSVLTNFQDAEDYTDAQVQEKTREKQLAAFALAEEELGQYRSMRQDLERLLASLEDPETVVGLLRVIAIAKIARIDEEKALGIKSGVLPEGPVSALRESALSLLAETASALQDMQSGATGMDAVRTNFFLGVIRFRQAVPRRMPGEQYAVEPELLAQAESLMSELADSPQVDDRWRSYSALYLGLIIPFRATHALDMQSRTVALDEANRRLNQALALDIARPDPQADPVSTSDYIPNVVRRQRVQIEAMRGQEPSAPRRTNDIQFSLAIGAHYDTNVPLLGENTALPRDFGDEEDFGFTLGFAIDYTLSLSDKWMLGAQARTSQLWHVDIDEFDEQRYGGSIAFQYELAPYKQSFGPVHLRLQYDYDYILLGRGAFVEAHRITPNLRVFWNDRKAETNLFFSYEIRDYREKLSETRFDRDGIYPEIGIVQSYKLVDMTPIYEAKGWEPWGHKNDDAMRQDDPDYPARFLTPYIGFQYSWDSTDGDEFDQNEFMFLAGALVPLPGGWDFTASAELQYQDYRHPSLVDFRRRPRRDFVQTYGVALSRTFVLRGGDPVNRYTPTADRLLMTVRAHATYTDDDSNVIDRLDEGIFTYDRTIFGLTFGFTFN